MTLEQFVLIAEHIRKTLKVDEFCLRAYLGDDVHVDGPWKWVGSTASKVIVVQESEDVAPVYVPIERIVWMQGFNLEDRYGHKAQEAAVTSA